MNTNDRLTLADLALLIPGAYLTLTRLSLASGELRLVRDTVRIGSTEVRPDGVSFTWHPDRADFSGAPAWGHSMARFIPSRWGIRAIAPTPAGTTPGTGLHGAGGRWIVTSYPEGAILAAELHRDDAEQAMEEASARYGCEVRLVHLCGRTLSMRAEAARAQAGV